MDKYIPYTLHRAALTLLMMLAITLTASATDFITDVMVAGHSNQNEFNTLIQNLQGQGWTDISQDLNQGCGSSSYYIHLLYKKQSSSGNTGVSITDFYVRTGANPPDNLTYGGRTYYLAPCQGNDNFVSGHGDLNAGCGLSSDYIFLYYTKDALSSNTGVTVITFNTTQSGAVGANGGTTGYDLNSGAHGSYIYMHLTTASGGNVVTLSSGSGNVALQNGHILTGTGGTETQVTIADGATVTFNGVNNTAIPDNSSHPWPGISCLGNATIVLNGSTTNSVKGGRGGSGIHVAANKTLTIQGSGTLNATGGYRGAGIGGGWGSSCGNIAISGGTVTATGGDSGAGIGSGYYNSSCGNITISGGTVTATGGQSAAGIGSGYYNSSCGNITITNGVTRVTATKGQSSNNAVGAGNSSTCGTVTIGGVQTGNINMSPFVTYRYTVAFDANGGTGTMNNQVFMYNVAQNLTANSFSRTNYSFDGWATSATGQKVYNDGQSVSNLTQNSGATVTLYAKWMPNAAHLSVSGNEYTIHTATGWNLFCDLLAENSNGYFTGKTVKLGTDIGVTRMAGSSGHEFSGTFDGQEHMLLVLFQNTNNNHRTAPFSYVNGATIQNLVVAGSITGTADRAAGIVGETGNSLSHVTNCVSSVNVSGGQYTAGISIGGKVEITGCLFNGTITGTSMSGGFVGSSDNALVISNCLFAPQEGSTISGGTFYYNGGGEITLVNSYYTTSLGTPQGKQAHSIAAGENVTLTINNQVTATYSVSGISAYSAGIGLTPLTPSPEGEDEVFYAGEGDAVSLNLGCTIPANYTFFGYQASEGTFTGTENPYTLTMPDADVTIQAILELIPNSINYIDGDSVTHTCNNFTVLLGNETTLEEGWYVVYGDLTYDHTLTLNGDVTFILRNGKTMTVAPESGEGLYGFQKSLTLYGQSLNSNEAGTLHVIGNGSNIAIKLIAGTYTQHSGKVIVSNSRRDAFYADNITMNGGCINASIDNGDGIGCIILTINGGNIHTNSNYGYGIYSSNLTFNGGKVEASRIYCGDNITLGWINTDDYIHAGRYEADGTISVKSGQAFYYEENDEQVIVSGTLNSGQIQAIGGKTLRPYYVNYMDGDGEVYICKYFTVLTGEEKTLDEGWYVVDHDITYDSTLTLNDSVTLILCNGMTMTVNADNGDGIEGVSMTLYGQSLDSDVAGTLNVTSNDEEGIALVLQNFTLHSGNVVASSQNRSAIDYCPLTVYGGSINARGRTNGISSSLTVYGGSINARGDENGINSNLIVHGGSVFANGGERGIMSRNVTIHGGTVTANGDNYGIHTVEMNIDGGNIEANGSAFGIEINGTAFGIPTNDLLVNGGTVIANGRDYGIRTYAGIVINDGTVTVTASDNFGNDESGEDKSDGDALGRGIHAAGDVIINGGIATVTVAGIDYGDLLTGRGIHADGDVIINDGLVTANSNVIGIHAYSNMIINGGKVEASRIYCESNITLGWTNTDDYIRAGGYTANYGDGIISVKSCQAFYYDNNVLVIGTLDEGQIQAIEGKTLRPYPLATYTLTPTAYTLTNGGYTDIPCTLSSLELDKPVWDGHSLVQVSSLSFYMNGGTLTDGAGHSIPFLVDKWPHSGAAAQMAQGDDFSAEGATFIMAVYIDPEVYDAAAPGTYTGEFVYDSYWNPSAEKTVQSIPGPSGSIALTLVIPQTSTIALSAGWNWWTPLVETSVNVLQSALGTNLIGIKSEAGPVNSGTLVPGQLYKIQTSEACTFQLTGELVTPVSVTFQQGVNWFGYTGADNLPIASALGSFTPALGDKIVSQNDGFVVFNGSTWEGTLPHLVPGQGYVYVSTSTTSKTLTMSR